MPLWLDNLLLTAVDAVYARVPYGHPAYEKLAACRIISHRGERDNRRIFENTYAAFDPLRGSGVHGIEFDLRWTRDLVPVVFHDTDLHRLFGDPGRVQDFRWDELHRRYPEIPDLAGFVQRYASEFHLMLELKYEQYPDPEVQNRRLAEALAPAFDTGRYHVISLRPEMFAWLPSIPAHRTWGIARFNTAVIDAEARRAGRGGVGTHYLMLRRADIERHHAQGRVVGSGFIHSRAVLHREINRGVDYLFTNRALMLQRLLCEALGVS